MLVKNMDMLLTGVHWTDPLASDFPSVFNSWLRAVYPMAGGAARLCPLMKGTDLSPGLCESTVR